MDDVEPDPEMAAAMGFTSFSVGKKRKYNANNEAVVDNSSSTFPKPSSKSFGSGANSIRVKERLQPPTGTEKTNAEGSEAVDKSLHTTKCHPASNKNKQLPDKSPSTRGPSAPNKHSGVQNPSEAPSKPYTATDNTTGPLSFAELQALRKGVRDEQGEIAYYLPSFVEDPWAHLTKRDNTS